jgi:hypothetical protein
MYIADQENHRIRKVTSGGTILTIAGNGTTGYGGDGGAATSASVQAPRQFVVISGSVVIVSDAYGRMRAFTVGGNIQTILGGGSSPGHFNDGDSAVSPQCTDMWGVAADSSGNYYASLGSANAVVKWISGYVYREAGTGAGGFSGDGAAAVLKTVLTPMGMAFDSSGNLYIADENNNRIRKVQHP